MFTGIIEELGKVHRMHRGADSARIVLEAPAILSGVKLGDSIAVNGVCLTVVDFSDRFFTAEVMAETLAKTNLGELKPGGRVNLERALRVGDRLGGHFVSGHIDGVGTITSLQRVDIAMVTEIKAPAQVLRYIVPKGSVAIDGISLTVVSLTAETFTVSLIPHTAGMTTMGFKKPGDKVNLECDMMGKYIERFMALRAGGSPQEGGSLVKGESLREGPGEKRSGMTLDFLADKGFI